MQARVARAPAGRRGRGLSQAAFQAVLARLLVEDDFRDLVRARGEDALEGDLTPVERRRLVAVASDPGLDVTRTLHDGWRFSKVLLMLPATCAVLGNERLGEEVRAFWKTRVPRSLYFHAEAIAFCDWLLERDSGSSTSTSSPRSSARRSSAQRLVDRAAAAAARALRPRPGAAARRGRRGPAARGDPGEAVRPRRLSPASGQVEWRMGLRYERAAGLAVGLAAPSPCR